MNHYTGNITPGKDIIPDNIWFSEEWYNAMQVETLRATSLQDGKIPATRK